MDLRARTPRGLEAQADLDALDGLDRAERLGEAAVQPPVPLDVGAQADRAAEGDDLEDPAQRVSLGLGVVDGLGDPPLRPPIGAADL